jgi:pyruvate,water dikinase
VTQPDLFSPNPMHHRCAPDDAWSTVNTRENYQGVMSPLGATLWLPISDRAVNGTFHDFGVLRRDQIRVGETPGEATSAVFFGRYSANLNYFRRMCDLIPGTSGAVFEEQIFGTVRADAPDYSSRRRYPVIAAKAPVTVLRLPGQLREMTTRMKRWWRRATGPAGLARPAAEQLSESMRMLEYAMRTHVSGTFVAQGAFDALGKLSDAAGRPGLHLRLCSGYGNMVEAALVSALDSVAHGRLSLADFLAEYGFRCAGEVEMSNPSWREQPGHVERLAVKYRAASDRADPAAQAAERTRSREAAERELLAALPAAKRPPARMLLRVASTFIPLREEGKAALAMGFDGARAACRARGRELVEAGVVAAEEDVFYLTLAEIQGRPPTDAAALVGQRRALRTAYEQIDVPGFWIGNPDPLPAAAAAPGASGGAPDERVATLSGLAAGMGVAEGRARVLHSADDCDELEPDEILVCRATDPSWASAFHLASAVVIDVGSLSSHGAIVAREMGLPCVINTGNGTSLLRTGDRLRVDGTAGVVTVLAPIQA